MRYRLIGLDLDGTLLNRRGRISAENLAAIVKAHDAGVMVVPCTGRSWQESHLAIDALIGGAEVGVFVTGAMVNDLRSGQTLDVITLAPDLVRDITLAMQAAGEPILLLRDRWKTGHDYLVTGPGRLADNTHRWFVTHEVPVEHVRELRAEHYQHVMRIGVVTGHEQAQAMQQVISGRFADVVQVHHFPAVHLERAVLHLDILEVFARGVDKWRGMMWVADKHNIAPEQIAVMGDQINDLEMMKQAGCRIAMGNAVDALKKHAHHITLDCDEHGVAHAIECLLAGKWG